MNSRMTRIMNGGESDYVRGDFVEDGSFLILQDISSIESSPSESPVSALLDAPPQVQVLPSCQDGFANDFVDSVEMTRSPPVAAAAVKEEEVDVTTETYSDALETTDISSVSNASSVLQASVRAGNQAVGDQEPGTSTFGGQLENRGSQLDTDIFSMTNYSVCSSISSNSTDAQVEDLKKTLDLHIKDNSKLRDLCAQMHERMKIHVAECEEMKISNSKSLSENLSKCEESRQKIENLEKENIALKKEVEKWKSDFQNLMDMPALVDSNGPRESDFEKLESMESQLVLKDSTIKQKDEISQHLQSENDHLKEIIRQNDELLRQKDEELNQRLEFLTKSDSALAQSLGEKDEFEFKVETLEKRISQLEEERNTKEQEAAEAKQQADVAKQLVEQMRCKNSELTTVAQTYRQDLDRSQVDQQRVNVLEAERIRKSQEAEELKKQRDSVLQELESARNAISELKNNSTELSASIVSYQKALDEAQQQMIVGLAAQKSEHDNQLYMFRINLQEEITEKKKFEIERQALLEELNAVNDRLNTVNDDLVVKTNQLDQMMSQQAPLQSGASTRAGVSMSETYGLSTDQQSNSQTSPAYYSGQVFGFLKRQREFLGMGGSASNTNGHSFEFVEGADTDPNRAAAPTPNGSCPICNKSFDSVQRLQRHAANCGIEAMAERSDPFVFP